MPLREVLNNTNKQQSRLGGLVIYDVLRRVEETTPPRYPITPYFYTWPKSPLPVAASQIVCVDAKHLKGEYEGVVLVMATKDSDNKLVMTAFAIVPKENADGYEYLFREAKKNAEMAVFLDNPKTIIYADGHKGSPAALSKELPLSQFRTCTKHLIGNLKKGIGPVRVPCVDGAAHTFLQYNYLAPHVHKIHSAVNPVLSCSAHFTAQF